MTEQEWLECSDPTPMLDVLRGKASARKLRLFAVACCRRIWPRLNETSRKTLAFVERDADGPGRLNERRKECFILEWEPQPQAAATSTLRLDAFEAARDAAGYSSLVVGTESASTEPVPDYTPGMLRERRCQSDFLRDIFGSLPFRPIAFDPAWRTSTVVSLATAIYDDRAFDRLPILADALEDAGCTSADVLNHCRQLGEHVRGCWVVDLLLGRK